MSKGNKCPVCGHWTYRCSNFVYPMYDGTTSSPYKQYYCSHCCFLYEETCEDSEEKQAHEYAQQLYGKDYDDFMESKFAEKKENQG